MIALLRENKPRGKKQNENFQCKALTQAIENATMECHHFNGDIKIMIHIHEKWKEKTKIGF